MWILALNVWYNQNQEKHIMGAGDTTHSLLLGEGTIETTLKEKSMLTADWLAC